MSRKYQVFVREIPADEVETPPAVFLSTEGSIAADRFVIISIDGEGPRRTIQTIEPDLPGLKPIDLHGVALSTLSMARYLMDAHECSREVGRIVRSFVVRLSSELNVSPASKDN